MDPELDPQSLDAIRSSLLPVTLQPVEHDPFEGDPNGPPISFDRTPPRVQPDYSTLSQMSNSLPGNNSAPIDLSTPRSDDFTAGMRPSINVEDDRNKPWYQKAYETVARKPWSEMFNPNWHSSNDAAYAEGITLQPVEHDPFVDVPGVGVVPTEVPPTAKAIGQGMANWAMAPGNVAAGQQPAVPGMWSDEDEARAQLNAGGQYQWGPQTATMMAGGASPFAETGAAGIFGGRLAKTADLNALARAQEMAKTGAAREDIWNATGWFQGVDNKWRFEIPDQTSGFAPGWSKDVEDLRDRFVHGGLYEAYPSTGDIQLHRMTPENPDVRGQYVEATPSSPAQIGLNVKNSMAERRSSTLHELQHDIQRQEDFPIGGSPDSPEVRAAADVAQTTAKARAQKTFEDILNQRDDYVNAQLGPDRTPDDFHSKSAEFWANNPDLKDKFDDAFNAVANPPSIRSYRIGAYRNLAGEVEARNVQTRANFSPAQRRAIPPWESADRTPEQQIQRFSDDPERLFRGLATPPKQLEMAAPAEVQGLERPVEPQQAPVLNRDPRFRGSMNTLDNVPFTYNGKHPNEWTPQEFKEVGDAFGVPNLGPESPAQAFNYNDGGSFNVPGGLAGKFTYYDLLKMKADGIDPSRMDRSLHTLLQQKLMRTMTPETPSSQHVWSGLTMGMTSPNNPLFPNQLATSILRMRDPALVDQLASAVPWQVGEKVSQADRLAASDKVADMLGLSAASKGGLGVRGSTDYSRIGELAQMWQKNPEFFRKTPDENWQQYVERLTSQVPGLSMKTGSFGAVWQNPAEAGISAIDRHMVNEFEKTGRLFKDPEQQADFEARAVDRWNRNSPDRQVASYDQLKQTSGSEGFLNGMKLEYVGNSLSPKFRLKSGEINPALPPHLANANWVVEPQNVNMMGEAYGRALDWNQGLAQQHGLSLFPSQWLEWDRIRRRFEPHENMFPGLENMPAMSRDQLREVSAEHAASGHKTYRKVEDEGGTSLLPTKPRSNPARFAYFTAPPLAAAYGLAQDQR